MDNKKEWKFKLPKNIPKELLKKDRLIIVLLAGILLVVIAIPTSTGEKEKTKSESTQSQGITSEQSLDQSAYTQYVESHLEEILSQVERVGNVKVMVTLKASSEKVVEKDTETSSETVKEEDSQGGVRSTMTDSLAESTVYDGTGSSGSSSMSDSQSPYVTKELSPVIQGIIVIADGGDDPVTVQNITEAVQALFDVDTHKIKVMKLNKNN